MALSLCLNFACLAVGAKVLQDRGGVDYVMRRLGMTEAAPAVPFDHKLATLELMPDVQGEIVFLGDSLTDAFMWAECFPELPVQNHGIGGNRVADVAGRLDRIIDRDPAAVFLNIGTNDIGDRRTPEAIAADITSVVDRIEAALPLTRVVLQSVPPRRGPMLAPAIIELNARLAKLAEQRGLEWVDFHDRLVGPDGLIRPRYTTDSVHLTAEAYGIWVAAVAETLVDQPSEMLSGHPMDVDDEAAPHTIRRVAMAD